MFSQYFGYYLLNKGFLTLPQLEQVLEYQRGTHVKLGLLAIHEGFMTPEQVEEVHQLQTQQDKRFGEIAIERGLLTQEQLYALLSSQKSNHLLIGQALVDLNFMNLYQITTTLYQYRQEHGLSSAQFAAIKKGDIREIVEMLIRQQSANESSIFVDYITLFSKNMIRFIDPHVRLEVRALDGPLTYDWVAAQEIRGEVALHTYIASQTDVWIDVAGRYAQEEWTEADEMAGASVGEFLNLQNGIFLVNMSNHGMELELKPQEVMNRFAVSSPVSALVLTVYYSKGEFDLIVSGEPVKLLAQREENENELTTTSR